MIALDGTPTKSRLGANALLGVSMAARAPRPRRSGCRSTGTSARCTATTRFTLPVPMMNILNGGAHADTSVDFQEFMVMPVGAAVVRRGAAHRRRDLPRAARHPEDARPVDRRRRRRRLRAEPEVEPRGGRGRPRGDRQGRASRPGSDVFLALDVASSELWAGGGRYAFKKSGEPARTSDEMVRLYEDWLRQYPIISIEDGLAEGDWDGWKTLTRDARRPRAAGRRRRVRDQPGDPAARHRRRRRQRAARQAESDRHRHRNARRGGAWRATPATRRSSRTAPAKPRTRRSPISRSAPPPARSRPARPAAPIASASTTSCCASKRSSAPPAAFAGPVRHPRAPPQRA